VLNNVRRDGRMVAIEIPHAHKNTACITLYNNTYNLGAAGYLEKEKEGKKCRLHPAMAITTTTSNRTSKRMKRGENVLYESQIFTNSIHTLKCICILLFLRLCSTFGVRFNKNGARKKTW
jgi:hypothetical protein